MVANKKSLLALSALVILSSGNIFAMEDSSDNDSIHSANGIEYCNNDICAQKLKKELSDLVDQAKEAASTAQNLSTVKLTELRAQLETEKLSKQMQQTFFER